MKGVKKMPKHITSEKEADIVRDYCSAPVTIEQIAEKYNVSFPSVIKILNKHKIARWSKSRMLSPELREDYFETIDTECKAYFLGLLLTDGNVYVNGNRYNISITLKDGDRYLIEKFLREIKCNKKITGDNRGCSEVAIRSKKMACDLSKYGIIPQKSLQQELPNNIDDMLFSHFLRGIMDGDGNLSFYSRRGRKVHDKAVRLCSGTQKFLEDLVVVLKNNLDLSYCPKVRQEKDNTFSISYRNKSDMYKILSYMYDDATIYMKRKKEIADKIMDEIREYRDN